MANFTSRLSLGAALTALALAGTVALAAEGKRLVNVDKNGVGVHGYDPVAYFTDNKAVKGTAEFVSEYEGVKYHFASADHKKLFDESPAKYAPQFGGYCAYAVSKNDTADIDPQAFTVQDGRLILQYSKSILEKWQKDAETYLKKADANWPKVVAKQGK